MLKRLAFVSAAVAVVFAGSGLFAAEGYVPTRTILQQSDVPNSNYTVKKKDGSERRLGSHDCPSCGGHNSLTILGSRAAQDATLERSAEQQALSLRRFADTLVEQLRALSEGNERRLQTLID